MWTESRTESNLAANWRRTQGGVSNLIWSSPPGQRFRTAPTRVKRGLMGQSAVATAHCAGTTCLLSPLTTLAQTFSPSRPLPGESKKEGHASLQSDCGPARTEAQAVPWLVRECPGCRQRSWWRGLRFLSPRPPTPAEPELPTRARQRGHQEGVEEAMALLASDGKPEREKEASEEGGGRRGNAK